MALQLIQAAPAEGTLPLRAMTEVNGGGMILQKQRGRPTLHTGYVMRVVADPSAVSTLLADGERQEITFVGISQFPRPGMCPPWSAKWVQLYANASGSLTGVKPMRDDNDKDNSGDDTAELHIPFCCVCDEETNERCPACDMALCPKAPCQETHKRDCGGKPLA